MLRGRPLPGSRPLHALDEPLGLGLPGAAPARGAAAARSSVRASWPSPRSPSPSSRSPSTWSATCPGWSRATAQGAAGPHTKAIWSYHAGLRATHPYFSKWYTWPWLYRPTWYYFNQNAEESIVRGIVAIGNPALWWVSMPVDVLGLVTGARGRDPRRLFSGLGYFFLYLPWGISPRTLNYSHYLFEAIPYACLSLGTLLDRELGRRRTAADPGPLLPRPRRRLVLLLPALPARPAHPHLLVLLRHQGLAALDLVPDLGLRGIRPSPLGRIPNGPIRSPHHREGVRAPCYTRTRTRCLCSPTKSPASSRKSSHGSSIRCGWPCSRRPSPTPSRSRSSGSSRSWPPSTRASAPRATTSCSTRRRWRLSPSSAAPPSRSWARRRTTASACTGFPRVTSSAPSWKPSWTSPAATAA